MIFAGDVAIAPGDVFTHEGFPDDFRRKKFCLNLEGAILPSDVIPKFGVCNSSEWTISFEQFALGPVFLANNHIVDTPNGIESTHCLLRENGLTGFGAGSDASNAMRAVESEGFVLIGFGWPVIGCPIADQRSPGTNRLEGRSVRRQVEKAMARYPGKKVIVVMYWNYEFELFPQPGHRQLALDLIDSGVHAVIGHHPHVVGPVERYQGKTIAYTVGNWAFSYGRFFSGRLRFPKESFHQIAVEISRAGDVVHHVNFEPPARIIYGDSEPVSSQEFSLRPEFEGFSEQDYLTWFRLNRRKKKVLPVYINADIGIGNLFRDTWVGARQKLIEAALRTGLKSSKRSV